MRPHLLITVATRLTPFVTTKIVIQAGAELVVLNRFTFAIAVWTCVKIAAAALVFVVVAAVVIFRLRCQGPRRRAAASCSLSTHALHCQGPQIERNSSISGTP